MSNASLLMLLIIGVLKKSGGEDYHPEKDRDLGDVLNLNTFG